MVGGIPAIESRERMRGIFIFDGVPWFRKVVFLSFRVLVKMEERIE